MDKYNYVILGSDWDLYKFSYSDLYQFNNVQYIPGPYPDLSLDTEGAVVLIEVNTTGQSAWFCQMVNGESLFGENTGKMLQLIRK